MTQAILVHYRHIHSHYAHQHLHTLSVVGNLGQLSLASLYDH